MIMKLIEIGYNHNTVNSRFKKDLNLQIHLHKAFFWKTGF